MNSRSSINSGPGASCRAEARGRRRPVAPQRFGAGGGLSFFGLPELRSGDSPAFRPCLARGSVAPASLRVPPPSARRAHHLDSPSPSRSPESHAHGPTETAARHADLGLAVSQTSSPASAARPGQAQNRTPSSEIRPKPNQNAEIASSRSVSSEIHPFPNTEFGNSFGNASRFLSTKKHR